MTEHLNQVDKEVREKVEMLMEQMLNSGSDGRTEDAGPDGMGEEDE